MRRAPYFASVRQATTIYALCDPTTGEVRYVGKTTKPLLRRLADHVWRARRCPTYCGNWILSLTHRPLIRALVVVEDADGSIMEQRIIAVYRGRGARLTNLTDGGEGAPGLVMPESAKRTLALARRGSTLSAETRAKIGAAFRGRSLSPEHRAKISAAKRGHPVSNETRSKLSKFFRARPIPEERRLRIAAAIQKRSTSPEYLARLSAGHMGHPTSAVTREKIGAAFRGKPLSPEHRAKMSLAHQGKPWSTARRAAQRKRCDSAGQ